MHLILWFILLDFPRYNFAYIIVALKWTCSSVNMVLLCHICHTGKAAIENV